MTHAHRRCCYTSCWAGTGSRRRGVLGTHGAHVTLCLREPIISSTARSPPRWATHPAPVSRTHHNFAWRRGARRPRAQRPPQGGTPASVGTLGHYSPSRWPHPPTSSKDAATSHPPAFRFARRRSPALTHGASPFRTYPLARGQNATSPSAVSLSSAAARRGPVGLQGHRPGHGCQ